MNLKNKVVDGVRTMPDGREVCIKTPAGQREYKKRLQEMATRQLNICGICELPMIAATFDHEIGRGSNGSRRDDRIVDDHGRWRNAAVHYKCNSEKGSKRRVWLRGRYLPLVEALERTA